MAILAIYPHDSCFQLALTDQDSKTSITMDPSGSQPLVERILGWLADIPFSTNDLQFIVTSGSLPPAQRSGLYLLDGPLLQEMGQYYGQTPENEGPIVAHRLAQKLNVPSYLVDPFIPNELNGLATITGTPEIHRNYGGDIFIFKYLARKEARKRGLDSQQARFVIAILAAEIQIGAVLGDRVLDLTNSREEGPFSLRQAGTLPYASVLDLCAQVGSEEKALHQLQRQSGLQGYLQIEDLSQLGQVKDSRSQLVLEALIYQISKEIGAFASALQGELDAILLAGELAQHLAKGIQKRVGFLGQVVSYPQNQGLAALQQGAERILKEEESILYWKGENADGIYGIKS